MYNQRITSPWKGKPIDVTRSVQCHPLRMTHFGHCYWPKCVLCMDNEGWMLELHFSLPVIEDPTFHLYTEFISAYPSLILAMAKTLVKKKTKLIYCTHVDPRIYCCLVLWRVFQVDPSACMLCKTMHVVLTILLHIETMLENKPFIDLSKHQEQGDVVQWLFS